MKDIQNKIISTALSISILISFSGCASLEKKNSKNNTKDYHTQTTIENILSKDRIEEDDFCQEYIRKLNEIKPEYNYSEYYYDNDGLYSEIENIFFKKNCQNQELGTEITLGNLIINNSFKYENNPFINEKIASVFKEALFNALKNIYSNNTSNLKEDYCKLSNVAIVNGDLLNYNINETIVGNYNNEEEKITLDYDAILECYNIDIADISFQEYFTQILEHELNHARQHICDCRKDSGQINDEIINDEIFSSFQEASAESECYTNLIKEEKSLTDILPNTFNYTYYSERRAQNLLMLLGLFKKDFTIKKYYEAIYDTDLTKLYNIYNIKNQEDLKTFYDILYALNSHNSRTRLARTLIEKGVYKEEELKKEIGSTYKIYIFREVIKDLINRISLNDINYEETIVLYNYVKAYVVEDEVKKEQPKDDQFIIEIKKIEDIFYQFLCEIYKINLQTIKEFDPFTSTALLTIIDYKELIIQNYKNYYCQEEEKDTIESIISKFPGILELTFTNRTFVSSIYDFNYILTRNLKK